MIKQTKADGTVKNLESNHVRPAPPTAEKIGAEHYEQIRMNRRSEYPDIGDQLDIIMKQFNQLRLNGQPMIQEMDDLIGKCLAVKSRNPFPDE